MLFTEPSAPLLEQVVSTRVSLLEAGILSQITLSVNRQRQPGTREISHAAVLRTLLLAGARQWQDEALAREKASAPPSPALKEHWQSPDPGNLLLRDDEP
jgi:hypothetical protein